MSSEFDITAWLMFRCSNCPNRKKRDGENSTNDHESCPIDEALKELSNNPTFEQVTKIQEKYGLIFNGQTGWMKSGDEYVNTANLRCANSLEEPLLPGIVVLEIRDKVK